MTPAKLDELQRLADAATKGPWVDSPAHWGRSGVIAAGVEGEDQSWTSLPKLREISPTGLFRNVVCNGNGEGASFDDACFIAAMRNNFDELIALARRGMELEERGPIETHEPCESCKYNAMAGRLDLEYSKEPCFCSE